MKSALEEVLAKWTDRAERNKHYVTVVETRLQDYYAGRAEFALLVVEDIKRLLEIHSWGEE